MDVLPPQTVKPILPAEPVNPVPGREGREGRPADLQLHQMLRATVAEGGTDKALLQLGDRQFWVATGSALKTGATLNLQVVETQPQLTLKIVEPPLLQRLAQSLHRLGTSAPPLELLESLLSGREPGAKQLPVEVRDALGRLFALLQQPPEQLDRQQLAALPRHLGLHQLADLLAGRSDAARATLANALGQLGLAQRQLGGELAAHLKPLQGALAQLPTLLAGMTEGTRGDLTQLPALLPGAASPGGNADTLAAVLRPLLLLAAADPNGVQTPAAAPPPLTAAGQEFVQALRQYLAPFAELTGTTLQRLEQQLALFPQLVTGTFEAALTTAAAPAPQGKDLLSVLLLIFRTPPQELAGSAGERAVRQLFDTLQKDLGQQLEQLGSRREEAQQQLDLWQLCRARFDDLDSNFVPLPLAFLDNGYLVARRQSSDETGGESAEQLLTLSLFLEMPKLGPLQVDLLLQDEKLFVRCTCRDQTVAELVNQARIELGDTLGGLPLAAFTVGTGAESPERALIRLLAPGEQGLIDTHI